MFELKLFSCVWMRKYIFDYKYTRVFYYYSDMLIYDMTSEAIYRDMPGCGSRASYQRSCYLRLLRQWCFHQYTEMMFSVVSVTLNFLHVSVKAFDLRWFSKIHEDIREENQEEISIIQNRDINMYKMRRTDGHHGHIKRKGEGCAIKCIY